MDQIFKIGPGWLIHYFPVRCVAKVDAALIYGAVIQNPPFLFFLNCNPIQNVALNQRLGYQTIIPAPGSTLNLSSDIY